MVVQFLQLPYTEATARLKSSLGQDPPDAESDMTEIFLCYYCGQLHCPAYWLRGLENSCSFSIYKRQTPLAKFLPALKIMRIFPLLTRWFFSQNSTPSTKLTLLYHIFPKPIRARYETGALFLNQVYQRPSSLEKEKEPAAQLQRVWDKSPNLSIVFGLSEARRSGWVDSLFTLITSTL